MKNIINILNELREQYFEHKLLLSDNLRKLEILMTKEHNEQDAILFGMTQGILQGYASIDTNLRKKVIELKKENPEEAKKAEVEAAAVSAAKAAKKEEEEFEAFKLKFSAACNAVKQINQKKEEQHEQE